MRKKSAPSHTPSKPASFLASVVKIQRWYRFINERATDAKRANIDRMLSSHSKLPASSINASNDTINFSFQDEEDELINTRISRIIGYLKTIENDTKSCIEDDTRQNSVFEKLKEKINVLKSQLQQKDGHIEIMQTQLLAIKQTVIESQAQNTDDIKSKLSIQRKEYEVIAKRQLQFIDKLIAEKQDLSEKYDALSKKATQIESQYADKTKATELTFKQELKHQKDVIQSSEKQKRATWISERTKDIKEETVKSLEPEIQRMLAHQCRQLEDRLNQEMNQQKSHLQDQHAMQLTAMRESHTQATQKQVDLERESCKRFYEKQSERGEIEFQAQKRMLVSGFAEERRGLVDGFNEERKGLHSGFSGEMGRVREECEGKVKRVMREQSILNEKHVEDEKRLRLEFEKLMAANNAKMQQQVNEREVALKRTMIIERDKEIDYLVEKLESENIIQTEGSVRRYDNELLILTKQHEKDMQKLRDQQRCTLEKLLEAQQSHNEITMNYSLVKAKFDELSFDMEAKDVRIKQQVREIEVLSQSGSQIKEKQMMKGQELAESVMGLTTKIEALSLERNESIATICTLRQDMERIKKRSCEERLKLIEGQVRKTVQTKDDMIMSLKSQLNEYKNRL